MGSKNLIYTIELDLTSPLGENNKLKNDFEKVIYDFIDEMRKKHTLQNYESIKIQTKLISEKYHSWVEH